MTFCSCNTITETTSGGSSLGGSATIDIWTIEGGSQCGGTASVSVSPDTYDGLVFVLPLDETGNGTADEYQDRGRKGLHGRGGNGVASLTPTIDSGVSCLASQHFDGDFISIPQDDHKATQGFSVSMWVKLDGKGRERTWYTRGIATGSNLRTFSLGHSSVNHIWARITLLDSDNVPVTRYCFSTSRLAKDKWYHVSAVWTPSESLRVFLNGVEEGTTDTLEASMVSLTNGGYLGRLTTGRTLEGNLQDVRFHPVSRTEDWLATEYATVCDSGFVVQGDTEEATSS